MKKTRRSLREEREIGEMIVIYKKTNNEKDESEVDSEKGEKIELEVDAEKENEDKNVEQVQCDEKCEKPESVVVVVEKEDEDKNVKRTDYDGKHVKLKPTVVFTWR